MYQCIYCFYHFIIPSYNEDGSGVCPICGKNKYIEIITDDIKNSAKEKNIKG